MRTVREYVRIHASVDAGTSTRVMVGSKYGTKLEGHDSIHVESRDGRIRSELI